MSAFDWGPMADGESDPHDAREERARALCATLSEADKRAMVSGDLPFWPGLTEMMGRYNARAWPAGELRAQGVAGVHFTDGPRGVALGQSTCFPVAMARGATWDRSLERRVGEVIGVEARAQGANLVGSACINLLNHPAWGRAQETFGEDTHHVGEMGAAHVEGVQRHVMACVKHFACNNIENSRFYVDAVADERTLREVYLPHFHRCVRAGAASVMTAYNKVNGEHCAESRALLTEVLKGEWGFDGFVISDWVFGLRSGAKAFAAGLDIDMPFRNLVHKALPKALAQGRIAQSRLDDAALRIVRQQLRFARVGERQRYVRDVVGSDEHRALAREVAARSMVLLKNEPAKIEPLLPLDASRLRRVAVIGALGDEANLGDRGSSQVFPRSTVSPLEGLRTALRGARVSYADGSNTRAAVDLARDADVAVVVVGLDYTHEGEHVDPPLRWDVWKVFEPPPLREIPRIMRAQRQRRTLYTAGDRASLGLAARDEALVRAVARANAATIVVLIGGSAISTRGWRDEVPAILMAWYPGMEGGHALADVLLGREEPSGRLPFAWPDDAAKLPSWWSPSSERVEYDALHGERLNHARRWNAAFALGHGLSYTRFSRTLVECVRRPSDGVIEARVRITNEGARRGRDLVMVRAACEDEPSRLVGFERRELAPGESAIVTVELDARSMARWETSRGWRSPRGPVTVRVAGDSNGGELPIEWTDPG